MSIRKKEPSLSILFFDKNIIDPDEINMTDIYRLPLTAGLSFIGFKVFGNFFTDFSNYAFFRFSQHKMPP